MYQPYEEVENEDDVGGREDPPRVVVNLLDALQRVPFHGESFSLFLKSQIKKRSTHQLDFSSTSTGADYKNWFNIRKK